MPGPGVLDRHHDALALGPDAHRERPALLHRLERVDDEVDRHLLQLLAVADRDAAVRREIAHDRRRRGRFALSSSRSRTSSTRRGRCTGSRAIPRGRASSRNSVRRRFRRPISSPTMRDAILQRRARRLLGLEAIEVAVQQMELEHRGVERVADLVREVHRELAHRRERLGVGGALLERAALGDVDPDAVDEIAATSRERERCQRIAAPRAVDAHALVGEARSRPRRARLLRRASRRAPRASRARSSSGIHDSRSGRPSACSLVVSDDARRLAVHQRDLVVPVERDDEHVGHLDEIAVAPLELLALVLQLDLRERLLDDRDELLGAERLQDERERARAKRADRGVDAREAGEEQDLGERRDRAQRLDEIDRRSTSGSFTSTIATSKPFCAIVERRRAVRRPSRSRCPGCPTR